MIPMLATPIDNQTLVDLCWDDDWIISQKIDGRRVLVRVEDGEVTAFGRDGKQFDLNYLLNLSFKSAFPNGLWCFDGEMTKSEGTHYFFFAFDMPLAGSLVTPYTPFGERLQALEHAAQLTRWDDHAPLGVLHYARTSKEKVDLVRRLHINHAEGVVLRNLNSRYREGERSPDCLKYKFVLEADCVVMEVGVDGKNNIVLGVYKHGPQGTKLTAVGKCTALAGEGSIVKQGDVVKIRYLYLSDDGKLVQPTYPLLRRDKTPTECTFDQLVPASREVLTQQ